MRRKSEKLGTVKMTGREIDVTDAMGRIDFNNLALEAEEAGAVATWWNEVAAITRRRARELEHNKDVIFAELRRASRAGGVARMEKITVDSVDDEAMVHPRYQQAVREWIEAEEAAEKAESHKFTVSHKQQTLREYSSRVIEVLKALGPPASAPRRTAVTS
jgi:hypothetical protein